MFLCAIVFVFGVGGNANATPIIGTPTAGVGFTETVGTVNSKGKIEFFIPLVGSDGIYGVDDYGTLADTTTAPINGPTMNMYLLFDVPVGHIGHTLTLTFTDLDLKPYNDPDRFFERLILNCEGGLPGGPFESYEDPILYPSVVSADTDGSILTFTGLTIGPGDSWIRLGFEAYSDGLGKGPWTNIAEYLTAELDTTFPIPEPATMLLLGSGLIGLAAFRRKFKK